MTVPIDMTVADTDEEPGVQEEDGFVRVASQRSRRHGRILGATPGTPPVQINRISLLSAEVDARVDQSRPHQRMDIPVAQPASWLVLWLGDMPRSVQDISESSSEDDQGVGHDGSITVFDPVDTDHDTDSVIDALQRDVEGDEIPAETPIDSQHLQFPSHSDAPDVWLVQGPQVEEVETVAHEEGSIFSTSGKGVFATDTEPDIVMLEVRENSAGIREGFRRRPCHVS